MLQRELGVERACEREPELSIVERMSSVKMDPKQVQTGADSVIEAPSLETEDVTEPLTYSSNTPTTRVRKPWFHQ